MKNINEILYQQLLKFYQQEVIYEGINLPK